MRNERSEWVSEVEGMKRRKKIGRISTKQNTTTYTIIIVIKAQEIIVIS